jgi:hypothetical protein
MPVKVATDSQDGFYINNFKTYNYNVNHYRSNDTIPQVKQDIDYFKDRLNEQLSSCGLEMSDNPQLLLNVGVILEERKQAKAGDPRYDINYTRNDLRDWEKDDFIAGYYNTGAITVDFVDMKNNQFVWQGTAIGIITRNERKMKERVQDAVEKMFLEMPKK